MTSPLAERLSFVIDSVGAGAVVGDLQRIGTTGATSQTQLQQQAKNSEAALAAQGRAGSASMAVIADGAGRSTTMLGRMSDRLGITESTLRTGIATAAAVGFGALIAKVGDAINSYVDLAGEVRDFQRASGAGAEESSRFVAVLDDLQISAETGSAALGKLARVDPSKLSAFNVEIARTDEGTTNLTGTLLNVADAYAATTDPAQRAQLGFAAFGKSYQDLIPLLEQGRAGLESYFDGVNEGQIYTQEALEKTRQYELSLDAFQDALGEAGQAVGRELVPALTTLLNAGASLLGVIDAIPGPLVQSAISAGVFAAGAIGISKAIGAIQATKPAETLAATAASATQLGTAAAGAEGSTGRFSRILGGLSRAGVAGAAVGALIPIIGSLAGAIRDAVIESADIDSLATSLQRLADTGKAGGAFADMGGIEGFKESLEDLDTIKSHSFAKPSEDFLGWFSQGAQHIEDLDGALTQLVESGDMDSAALAWDALTAAAKEQGIPVEDLKRAFPQYAQAIEDAALAQSHASASSGELNAATLALKEQSDATSEAVDQLRQQIERLNGGNLSLAEADIAARDSMASFTETVNEHKKAAEDGATALDRTTQAGRDNESALIDQIKAAQDLAEATTTATGSTDAGRRAFQDQIGAIRDNMIALGFNAGEVDRLIGLYGRVPSSVPTTVTVRDEATGQLQTITQAANGLDGRVVTLTVKEKFISARVNDVPLHVFDGPRASGGAVEGRGTYLVGEVRPELFRPAVAGTIVPTAGFANTGGTRDGALMHVDTLNVRQDRDIDEIAAALAWAARR